jgi:uncharacterized protein (TIGR02284 family)
MRIRDRHHLEALIALALESALAYRQAASRISPPALQAAFRKRAQVKTDLLDALAGRLESAGNEVHDTVSLSGRLRLWAVRMRAALSEAPENVFLRALEADERRLLLRFQRAVSEVEDPGAARQLREHLPFVRATRQEMRTLKHKLAF